MDKEKGVCSTCTHKNYCTLSSAFPVHRCEEFAQEKKKARFKFEEMGIEEGQIEWEKNHFRG